MSLSDQPIDEAKPEADLQEQERPDLEVPDDPEVTVPADPDVHSAEADPADAVEQRLEVPLDDDLDDEVL
ncbi:hypothetical protein [Microbacterium paraoxydans]|uniref:hypothetical protein n=1 Tax=Microbacterium paraoxydans TaxID=199592 RepID=UPI003D715014